ncbi:cytochrome P450 [Aspergillus mulundensis]|uniref:Putative Cytochrome P450 n=1 Tax=Aspergillus mulundensis TaxID=1810919 RepID=A0A3D8SB37_9EURO|nr:putative Cytochrome P450 [Aspergillus mulundensis]RDW83579.1 putative Cytochrome P450 [Aspergillus mulundensis]
MLTLLLQHPCALAAAAVSVYLAAIAIYRLYLSPIAHFPGPRLAALTVFYEFYWEAVRNGQFTFHIGELHKKYGSIVRISPTELHVNDPEFYEVLYSRDSPRNKYPYYQRTFNAPYALITCEDHFRHRLLRSQLNPFFSVARIRQLEPTLKALVDKLCRRLEELKSTGKPIAIEYPLTCYTTDVITDYTMGDGYHYLDEPDFIPQWQHMLCGTAKTLVFVRPVAFLLPLLVAMPETLTAWLNPGMELFFAFQHRCRTRIAEIAKRHRQYGPLETKDGRQNLFDNVLSSSLPEQEKSEARLAQDMQVFVSAGAETTAKAMSYILFYLHNEPALLQRLKDELAPLGEDPGLIELEQLPFLTGVMLEGLRLSYGVTARLPRIAPYNALAYKDWTIPPGTPVSMSCLLMHHDESVFPDSYRFNPERWVEPAERKRLEKYMVAFSRGSRMCIGMQLARSEILLVISTLLRRINFELYETTIEDVRVAHDIFIPFVKMDSKGVRFLIK